jgi:hypothetical protein
VTIYASSVPGSTEYSGSLTLLQHAVFHALRGDFPIMYGISKGLPLMAATAEELIAAAKQRMAEAREFMEKNRHLRPPDAPA